MHVFCPCSFFFLHCLKLSSFTSFPKSQPAVIPAPHNENREKIKMEANEVVANYDFSCQKNGDLSFIKV